MKQNTIILKESELHSVIAEAVKKVIAEEYGGHYGYQASETQRWLNEFERLRTVAFNPNIDKDDLISKLVKLCDYAKDCWAKPAVQAEWKQEDKKWPVREQNNNSFANDPRYDSGDYYQRNPGADNRQKPSNQSDDERRRAEKEYWEKERMRRLVRA